MGNVKELDVAAVKEASFELGLQKLGSLLAQAVKNLPARRETRVPSLGWEDSPGEGNGYPLQYSCLENFMDRGAWQATDPGVSKSLTTED